MIDIPYKKLDTFIRGLAGTHNFTYEETIFVESFVNERARQAYTATSFWPRYLKVGIEKTIESGPDGGKFVTLDEGTVVVMINEGHPFRNAPAPVVEYYSEQNTAQLIDVTSGLTSVNVTYKLPLEPIYKEKDSPVPEEFFYFLGHGAYADFLRMEGQTEKATVEESFANRFLQNELATPGVLNNAQHFSMRIRTQFAETRSS